MATKSSCSTPSNRVWHTAIRVDQRRVFADPRGVHECFLFPFSPDLRVSSGGPSPASRFVSWTWSPPLLAPHGAGPAACQRTSFEGRPQAAAAESQSYSLSCSPEWHHNDINEHLFLLRVRQDLQRVHRQLHCFFSFFFLSVLLDRPNEQCAHARQGQRSGFRVRQFFAGCQDCHGLLFVVLLCPSRLLDVLDVPAWDWFLFGRPQTFLAVFALVLSR